MKKTAVALVLCMSIMAFGACGKTNADSNIESTEAATEEATEQSGTTSSADIEYNVNEYVTLGDYKNMEVTFGKYCFIYPKSTQEIKDEAVSQNNCVSSYIKDVINGECDILFLRKKDNPAKSLVTIEVRNGQIVQAKRKFNYDCTKEQEEVINRWNDWYKNKLK